MNVTLRIERLELQGILDRGQIPEFLHHLEKRLAQQGMGSPASIQIGAVGPLYVPKGVSARFVADSVADALLEGPLASAGATP